MERVAVITPDSTKIKEYLMGNINNVEVWAFNDIFLFYKRLKQSAFRADTLLIMDNGMRDTTYGAGTVDSGAALLKEILADMPLVEIERVLYLNLDKNKKHKDLIEFLQGSKQIKARIILATYPEYQAIMIKELLIQNSQTYEDKENKFKYVIRKNRNEKSSSRILNQYETNKAVILEHKTYNPEVDFVKGQLTEIVGQEQISTEVSDEEVIGSLDIDVDQVQKMETFGPQIIAVIGESKSGTSVTSMILGASAAVNGQTLLVDMNYTNLGLSYLVEKTLVEEEIQNIKMEDIISVSDGVVKLREAIYHKNNLHVLTNSLPAKRKMSKSEFGFIVSNILRLYRPSYKYIILDIPVSEIEVYSNVLSMVDKVVLTSPPYMNNIISLLSNVSKSILIKSPAFSSIEDNVFKNVLLLRTRVFSFVNKEIKPVKFEVVNRYAKEILKAELKVAGIYQYTPKSYLDTLLFKYIIES